MSTNAKQLSEIATHMIDLSHNRCDESPTVMAIKSGNWLLRRTTKSLLILAAPHSDVNGREMRGAVPKIKLMSEIK